MAAKATICKAELQVNDMDRHHYGSHALTLAQHPSETDERLMLRLLAFALHADERLAFGRGISAEDEPDLWRKDLTGAIDLWIELGQPDEARLRRACGRARQVVVLSYGGRGAGLWWDRIAPAAARCRNLSVLEIDAAGCQALAARYSRSMKLQCFIEDGQVQLLDEAGEALLLQPVTRQAAA
jgi:uncharacterized protein YaeQ